MSIRDLRGFLQLLAERGELCRIRVEVDPVLEIAAITDRVGKQSGGGKALWFEQVRGHGLPVLTNLFGSLRRVAWALRCDQLEDLNRRLSRELELLPGGTVQDRLQQLLAQPAYRPRRVDLAPCREIVVTGDADLEGLPALQSWPGDGGRYLTLPLVFSRDPVGGKANCGMYRLQILDRRTAAIHFGPQADGLRHFRAWQARGEAMPVAIALGGDPALIFAAGVPLPADVDEVALAGYLSREPVALTPGLTCDLEVPAFAEIVIEGWIDPAETCREGPFGNHTGYYVEAAPAPVVRISAITRRRDALFPCTVVGRPPMEDCYLAKATERLLLPLLQCDFPAIQDINFPLEGIFHGCALIALTPEFAGQGRTLIEQLWRQGLLRQSRLLVVFDADVDVQNLSDAYWRAINRVQAERDVLLDGQRIGIDASGHQQRQPVTTDPATRRLLERRWAEYRIG